MLGLADAATYSCLFFEELTAQAAAIAEFSPSNNVTEWRLRPGERAPIIKYEVTCTSMTESGQRGISCYTQQLAQLLNE